MQDQRRLKIPESYPYQEVVDVVSPNDTMLAGEDFAHYLSVGISAIANVTSALQAHGSPPPKSILDMPCGHGRVTRALKSAFPASELFACDIDEDGVRFCARAFTARPLVSRPDFRMLDFGRKFDLIWVGSLVTHLPADVIMDFFACMLRHLAERGVAVVSTHGAYVAGRIVSSLLQGGDAYGVPNPQGWQMLEDYFSAGFGYGDYPSTDLSVQRYGVSLATRRWMCDAVTRSGGHVISYNDHAWDRHHDVLAFARRAGNAA